MSPTFMYIYCSRSNYSVVARHKNECSKDIICCVKYEFFTPTVYWMLFVAKLGPKLY